MHIAIMLFSSDLAMRPDAFAAACEARGFESVWFPEHTHIPTCRRTPLPGGGELPEDYWRLYDPFVAMTAAAIATTEIKVATGVYLVTEHHPISMAKAVASLDVLSGGRLIFGIGTGWNAEEMEHHGTAFETRWKVLEERIEAMKLIWTEEEAEYHGDYVDFDPIWSYPKPVQRPYPPIVMGAWTAPGRERVARYCDGWVPIGRMMEDFGLAIADLHERLSKHGRKPEDVEISDFWATDDLDTLKTHRDLGVHRSILPCPSGPVDETLRILDRYAAIKRHLDR
jgi:probable F420-dependent oxidoreductase